MAGISINIPVYGDQTNCVYFGSLKSVDNLSSLLKGYHKVLLEVQHGKVTSIVNTNRNSISIKLSVASLAIVLGCTSHAGDVRRVSGGQKSDIFIDTS